MLDIHSFQRPDPYVPLPEEARQVALTSINKQGFTALEDYSFFSLRENQPVKTNMLAFAHPIHRTPEYTGLTVFNATNGHSDEDLVSLLARSAAPFHLLHRDGAFSFWTCPIKNRQPNPQLIEPHIAYDHLDEALDHYKADLSPKNIVHAKQGLATFTHFRNVEPLQLSLWAIEVTQEQLIKHFAATVAALRTLLAYSAHLPKKDQDELATTLSIQLLGALILADTGVLTEEMRKERPPLDKLMQKASAQFGQFFSLDLFTKHAAEAEEAYHLLRQICYAGFAPDMLGHLQGAAYSQKERKESRTYTMPLHLARHIWNNIPLKFLHPQKRIVADMACGWGSFLIAGYERMAECNDMWKVNARDLLHGNEEVPFTAKLARLGLLLSATEDGWHVDTDDPFQWSWWDEHQPSIIIGNPPGSSYWEAVPDQARDSARKMLQERANCFLEQAINRLAPQGYLAVLMPSSFASSRAAAKSRQHLQEQCDLLELWNIPPRPFEMDTPTIVLFAQKKEDPTKTVHYPVRVRTIQPQTPKQDEQTLPTISGLVPNQADWPKATKKSFPLSTAYLLGSDLTGIPVSGSAEAIDAEPGTITLWLHGFEGSPTIPIPPSMPGWAFRPDNVFCANIPFERFRHRIMDQSIPWGAFYEQPFTYFSEEELMEDFADFMSAQRRETNE